MNTVKQQNTPQQRQKIGLLGGTFDPIHYGHITPAIATAKWLALDSLHLLPAHIPPHKQSTTASSEQRKTMVELVCQQFPIFELDSREMLRNAPSYTVDSLAELKQELPNSQIFFIMGMDSLLSFTHWHQWQQILSLCHLVVNVRPGYQMPAQQSQALQTLSPYFIKSLEQLAHLSSGHIIIHQQPALNISSTAIRAEIKQNTFDNNKLPTKVIDYIKQQQLYGCKD